MKVSIVQHVEFEGPGAIAEWAEERGYSISTARMDLGEKLPSLNSFDMLVIMGGPMSVNDEAVFPWLVPEKQLVAESIRAGKKVLGICLGAQMIASSLGNKVYRAPLKEIGWFPVQLTVESQDSDLFRNLPDSFTPLHWHGETFDLPGNARLLASTHQVTNQAFEIDGTVLGLQFHLEATAETVASMLSNCADDIGDGPFQQSVSSIAACEERCAKIRPLLYLILDSLVNK